MRAGILQWPAPPEGNFVLLMLQMETLNTMTDRENSGQLIGYGGLELHKLPLLGTCSCNKNNVFLFPSPCNLLRQVELWRKGVEPSAKESLALIHM